MNPKIWGPHAWIFLHSIAYGYPENPTKNEQVNAKKFFESLGYMLPCKTCSTLYIKDIKKIDSIDNAVKNKNNLIKWVNQMHNKVNENLNKKQYSDSEYKNYYLNMYTPINYNKYYFILFILVFFIIIYLYIM